MDLEAIPTKKRGKRSTKRMVKENYLGEGSLPSQWRGFHRYYSLDKSGLRCEKFKREHLGTKSTGKEGELTVGVYEEGETVGMSNSGGVWGKVLLKYFENKRPPGGSFQKVTKNSKKVQK